MALKLLQACFNASMLRLKGAGSASGRVHHGVSIHHMFWLKMVHKFRETIAITSFNTLHVAVKNMIVMLVAVLVIHFNTSMLRLKA